MLFDKKKYDPPHQDWGFLSHQGTNSPHVIGERLILRFFQVTIEVNFVRNLYRVECIEFVQFKSVDVGHSHNLVCGSKQTHFNTCSIYKLSLSAASSDELVEKSKRAILPTFGNNSDVNSVCR